MSKNDNIIAKFQIGAESVDDGIGSLIVRQLDEVGNCEVFVEAGMLPNGDDRAVFGSDEEAVGFAVDIIKQHWRELLNP